MGHFWRKWQNQFFSPSINYRATVDHYNVLKLYFRVMNLIIESNLLSKSALRTEIGQSWVEMSLKFLSTFLYESRPLHMQCKINTYIKKTFKLIHF